MAISWRLGAHARRVLFCLGVAAPGLVALGQVSRQNAAAFTPVSADGSWTISHKVTPEQEQAEPWIRPMEFEAATLVPAQLRATLTNAPTEADWRRGRANPLRIELPDPDGFFERFDVVEAPVMAPELAAKYPEIKTYLGMGVDDIDATMRMTVTPSGVDVQVLSPSGTWYIDRYNRDDTTLYSAYTRAGYARAHRWACEADDAGIIEEPRTRLESNLLTSGSDLRTYRLAVATTGEYTSFHGGTVSAGLSAVVTAVNRVTGIYEVEVAARMVLVGNEDDLIYTNSSSDPYSNSNGGTMLGQNQSNIDSVIGSANYDIGHVFSTGGGGVAYLGVVCRNGSKAGGVTGLGSPIGDAFWVDYVAHEMGHQFGANHTFNSSSGACGGGNRNGSTALEPGSGSTIMAYAGICGSDDLQNHSDAFFHGVSYDEIRNYITSSAGGSCPQITTTGNAAPTIDAGPDRAIPTGTPFTLTAATSDPNGDPVTVAWEQRDLGASSALSDPDNGNGPLFRARPATASPSRTFPQMSTVLSGVVDTKERLPEVGRTMHMRATARDNRSGGGGVETDDIVLTVVGSAGPFEVTAPAQNAEWGAVQVVQWDVAGTNASPISCTSVDILLSTDNGATYPTVLASGTPNDGSQVVNLPQVTATNARIMIRANDNYFFAVSRRFSLEVVPLTIALLDPLPETTDPGVGQVAHLIIAPGAESIVEGSATLHARVNGGPFLEGAIINGGGNSWQASLPAILCDEDLEFYFSVEGSGGSVVTLPANAPATLFDLTAGSDVVSFEDNFQTDKGWTVSGNAGDGQWERGTPANGDRGDPASDADGSGLCYLTDNVAGNSDVDDGSTILTSPAFDTTGGATITWSYWLNDISNGELGSGDGLSVEISFNNGAAWSTLRTYSTASSSWRADSFEVPSLTGVPQFRIRFTASDVSPGNVVEAGIDAFSVGRFECVNPPSCPADLADPSGVLNIDDVLAFLGAFADGDASADLAAPTGQLNIDDVLAFLGAFAAGCP